MTANDLTHIVQRLATKLGGRLFRNNSGRYKTEHGRWVQFGVPPKGGSDLIGWMPGGRFAAVEIKVGRDKLSDEQAAFLAAVIKAGGIGGVVRTVEDAEALLNAAAPSASLEP